MGKVVRSAHIDLEKYLVAIPQIDVVFYAQPVFELDERYAAPLRASGEIAAAPIDPGPPPLPPRIDWEALQQEANALIDRASQEAQALLRGAATQSSKMIAQAQASVEQIESDARTLGHERGVEAGREAIDAEMSEMLETMRRLIASARDERHTIIESAESELVALAMAIGERIVHQHIAIDPNVVVENVRSALMRLVSREIVTLRVHPADLETIREHRDALVASNDVEHLRLIEDQRVDRGGVVLETESGTIDAKVATQLREARKALHADETIALAPSGDQGVLHSPAQAS